jgi:5-methylcytosine-specific restriction enzyme subunit McrC
MRRPSIPSPRLIQLQEWKPTELNLDAEELAELQAIPARLNVQPTAGRYVVTPGSVIGTATSSRLHIVIEPKLSIDRVLALLGYARNFSFEPEATTLGTREGIVEPFVGVFLDVLQRALRRGLLMSYLGREEALATIRGRLRFAEQARRRYGLPLPIEVRYDDYTVDIEANRLVKAALRRVERIRLRDPRLRRRVAEALASFDGVTDASFDPRHLPVFSYTRLDERYRPVLELATLLVRNTSVDLHSGEAITRSILFDMNDVFEDFVWAAIGDQLRRTLPANYRWRQGKSIALDEDRRVRPEPDLSLWDGARCVFVGDAKYKSTEQGEVADLYQLLAYCSAAALDEGLLLYAEKPSGPSVHRVVRGGPRLRVETIDLTRPFAKVLDRCKAIALEIAAGAGASHVVGTAPAGSSSLDRVRAVT